MSLRTLKNILNQSYNDIRAKSGILQSIQEINNADYLKHRAIEAIKRDNIVLAISLLVLYEDKRLGPLKPYLNEKT